MADLFREISRPTTRAGTKQWYTVPLSIVTHIVGLSAVIVIPLLASDALPTPQSVMAWVVAPPAPPPPAPPPASPTATPPPPPDLTLDPRIPPTSPPSEIRAEPPQTITPVVGAIPNSLSRPASYRMVAAPPPPAGPIRVGGNITPPVRIKFTPPVYPPMARAARMSGVVLLEATIGKDGSVMNLRSTRPGNVFDQAALDAVRQWKYTPTILNGEAVEVIMSVNVMFTLN